MNPAQKALWFIESHLANALTLDEIAGVAGISRFHLVRAFAVATGFSVMRYVRARRLSEAARALAGGAPDILNLALDADYGSHEAFTRAFRDHFGVTPEAVRSSGADPHGLNRHGQTSTAALYDRQAALDRRGQRPLQPRERRRHSRPLATLPSIGG
jgi:AraC-like DNA-binding protein